MRSGDQGGTPDARALMPLVYDELRGVAERLLRRQPANFTLRPTELVHEAWLHLIRHAHVNWTSAAHFRAIAAHKLWQVVVDHLKHRYAQKRGGLAPAGAARATALPTASASADGTALSEAPAAVAKTAAVAAPDAAVMPRAKRVPLERVAVEWHDREVDLLDLADAMADLAAESRRLHDIVMLHWFGGLKHAEVAEQLEISQSTAEKDFRYALAWLRRRLAQGTCHAD